MSHFTLPYIHNILQNSDFNFKFEINKQKVEPIINKSLFRYLSVIKQQIDDNPEKWDIIKKYTNPFEFIHTTIPNLKFPISKYVPISRSYFKLIEILKTFYILEDLTDESIQTFHLAEGPGGFIEAIVNKRENPNDKYHGMTLQSSSDNVPGWKKSKDFLKKNKNVFLENGFNGTGDLYSSKNLEYCYKKYKNSMNIITADGGFDFSVDFNKQEILSSRLIFSQVVFAILLQKKDGIFILKIFDIFDKFTVDIIYLLNILYNKIYIVKPNTSRYANSEKYVVCKGFRLSNSECYYNLFLTFFEKLNNLDNHIDSPYNISISNILNIDIPYYFLIKLEELNAVLGQKQIEVINNTINLIETDKNYEKIKQLQRINIQKCINWCNKHKIIHNKNVSQSNIFLQY